MDNKLKNISTFEQSLTEILETFKMGNPWVVPSENIKDVVIDTHKYEYGIFRSKGFRTVTESDWEGGRRVMTTPYMTEKRQIHPWWKCMDLRYT